jgi:hypothetical protein
MLSREVDRVFEFQSMDDDPERVLDVDALVKDDHSTERIGADNRSGLVQRCGNHCRNVRQLTPLRIEEGIDAIAKMEIIGFHARTSHQAGALGLSAAGA